MRLRLDTCPVCPHPLRRLVPAVHPKAHNDIFEQHKVPCIRRYFLCFVRASRIAEIALPKSPWPARPHPRMILSPDQFMLS
jgi:hypothetical protein